MKKSKVKNDKLKQALDTLAELDCMIPLFTMSHKQKEYILDKLLQAQNYLAEHERDLID